MNVEKIWRDICDAIRDTDDPGAELAFQYAEVILPILTTALDQARAEGPGWQPIETFDQSKGGRYLFWLDWSDECAPLNPPLDPNDPQRIIHCSYRGWPSIYKAVLWQPLPTPPAEGERNDR
jgi:hypothetical protein